MQNDIQLWIYNVIFKLTMNKFNKNFYKTEFFLKRNSHNKVRMPYKNKYNSSDAINKI